MSVENIKKLKAEKGFTIVELLIVIVVIGILAAIVIVAYTGITQQANNNKAKSNASSVQKVAETMNADETGSYPASIAAFSTGTTSTKLPQGVTVTSSSCTCANMAAAQTQAGTALPATSSTTAYNTVAVYRTPATGTITGGVIFHRLANGNVSDPIYYGAATSSSAYAQLP